MQAQLQWIEQQASAMQASLKQWALINSGSFHLEGLKTMASTLSQAFSALEGELELLDLPPLEHITDQGKTTHIPHGQALRVRKRPDAPFQVFLGGHMDTVFGKDHPFQDVKEIDSNTWNGPGLSDMKGGLMVMLYALQALEQSPYAQNIGWEVLINPDEEIGSHGSAHLLAEAAKRNHIGLLFEPATSPDGTFAGARKGSGNFTAVFHGKPAHAGREFEKGRNAICAAAEFIQQMHALNGKRDGVTINMGFIHGGGPVNVVPDTAVCRFNIRIPNQEDGIWAEEQMQKVLKNIQQQDGISASLHGSFKRAAKPITPAMQTLLEQLQVCGGELGLSLGWVPTGGCCDGNDLAAAGLPNLDTLGVRGGKIHSSEEFVLIDSLPERAKLVALLLMKWGSGDLDFKPFK